jgi:hypothetical protein
MLRVKTKGQTTLEVVILIGFVVAALIAMGVYMRRGIQGRLKDSTDQIGEQYSAGNTTGAYTIKTAMTQVETTSSGGLVDTEITRNQQTKAGSETISNFAQED